MNEQARAGAKNSGYENATEPRTSEATSQGVEISTSCTTSPRERRNRSFHSTAPSRGSRRISRAIASPRRGGRRECDPPGTAGLASYNEAPRAEKRSPRLAGGSGVCEHASTLPSLRTEERPPLEGLAAVPGLASV